MATVNTRGGERSRRRIITFAQRLAPAHTTTQESEGQHQSTSNGRLRTSVRLLRRARRRETTVAAAA